MSRLSQYQIIGITPFENPDPALVAALFRAGALPVLDVGRDRAAMQAAFERLAARRIPHFGVRIPNGVVVTATQLPVEADVVITGVDALDQDWGQRELIVEVLSLAQAREAIARGASGLIAKGAEAGGEGSDQMAFVLLQQLRNALGDGVALWLQGGIGVHTAAACIAGGATGVVIDSQLALVRESTLSSEIKAAIHAMDASGTKVIAGHRVFVRPDLPAAKATDLSVDEVRSRLGGRCLRDNFIPAGQDAALARSLADRHCTAGGVVGALREGIRSHLQDAQELAILGPDSTFAARYGLRYPITQGPMSRVSDRARFANEVSLAGGLPFLALSLLRGDQVRDMVRETAELLGDRAWGVGLIGFAPPALFAEQLEALAEFKPPVALIAGGRPAQAKLLEQRGISTFVHAPSPGLLGMFLKDGVRKFVFEGRECGGHVGPRSSFVLWERVVERLLSFPRAEELELLFAGGIHDGRSAAMVAAVAAPLAAKGARVGVLMGTAYLFTREAVDTGAIAPNFQRNAIACTDTVLLETAPGHATRCVSNEYVDTFAARKAQLVRDGATAQTLWGELEQLNLGRLRIAAKGLRRDGDKIVAVDEAGQQRDGMFMIGQVATMRDDVCSMAELHAEVSDGSARVLAALPTQRAEQPAANPADVAIVGMACVFPNAADLPSYWSNIVSGDNAITEVPDERWNKSLYYDANATGASAGRKTPSKWGGFLPDVSFDPLAYGIPPRSLAAIEPVQLLSLEVARRALADAGYADRPFARERTSVIFGAEAGTELSGAYGFRASYPQLAGELPAELDEHLPTLTEDSFPGVLANVIAGRIANRLDLGGVNFTVDAACASSLAALDAAVKELGTGNSDVVLCGGADVHNSINDYLLFSSVHALSPTGQCRTFDKSADGIVLGEGVGCVVLKRLADAERDGDRIYAVLKSVAGSSDGRSLGLTAPRKEGQKRALERAYERGGVSPADVGLVEAHGTGTVVGDRTELATLTEVFEAAGAVPGSCALGSVKSQIGHTKCAAGIAGLIKASLCLHAGVRPPTLHIEQPNAAYDAATSPFQFSATSRPWLGDKRVAALSALGFGGTNFHAVVSAYDGVEMPSSGQDKWPAELFIFRGADRDSALAQVNRLVALLAHDTTVRLRDLAAAVTRAQSSTVPVQITIVASDLDDLRTKLAGAQQLQADPRGVFVAGEPTSGKVAFLFPGQGSQRLNMLADLFVAFPRLQRYLGLAEDLVDTIFPPTGFADDSAGEHKRALTDTRSAQPALGMVDLAMAELIESVGIKPDVLGGHSYGELVALCHAGRFDAASLIELSRVRATCITEAVGHDPGTMAAVRADADAVAGVCRELDGVVLANLNTPRQTVISGGTAAIESAVVALKAAGLAAKKIPVACAFHSPIVGGAQTALANHLAAVPFASAKMPVWSNTTATPYPDSAVDARALLARQVASPVRFVEQIESMYEAGTRVFVEVGPGGVLSGLVGKILGDRPHHAIATDAAGQPGVRQFLMAVAKLAAAGVSVDLSTLFSGRDIRVVDLAQALPVEPKAAWRVNGHTAHPAIGDMPKGGYKPSATPVVITRPSSVLVPAQSHGVVSMPSAQPVVHAPVAASPREAAMVEFMRTMREMVTAQRDVMMAYLGQPAHAIMQPVAALAAAPVAAAPAPAPVAAAPAPAVPVAAPPAPAVPVAAAPAVSLETTLLAIVSERTGYPSEMLELDLDLEAELSIDSIKRIEILGELRERVGLSSNSGASDEEVIEELSTLKTLREIIDWLEANEGQASATDAVGSNDVEQVTQADQAPQFPLERYEVRVEQAPAPALNGTTLDKRTFAITDDGRGIAPRVAALLESHGATATILAATDVMADVDGLIHLQGLAADANHSHVKRLFCLAKQAAISGAKWIVATTALGGRFGRGDVDTDVPLIGGPSGMLKSFAREWPQLKLRLIDVDAAGIDVDELAASLVTELLVIDRFVEVGYADGQRHQLVCTNTANPAGQPTRQLQLNQQSVVLITGGARGITARVAIAIAERYRCHLVLVGRSAAPHGDEDPRFASATDLSAVRALLVRQGLREPRVIEAEAGRLLRERQIRQTLASIRSAGASVDYRSLDVRDSAAFAQLVDELYTKHGRIAGVIHGAGVIEDKLIVDKTTESFNRVFDTKIAAANVLSERLRADVEFVAFFGSVSGVFGNRGQVDYAAANDGLDKIAIAMNRRLAGRVVSVDWGPWAGTGMVSAELEREYARRGVGLIPPQQGIEQLLTELSTQGDAQVVLMCASCSAMAMPDQHDAAQQRPTA